MTIASRHDVWADGDSYDSYMGRWSRQIAPLFLDWLGASEGLDWLEVGCGTGALSAAILERWSPKSLTALDPSESFIAKARNNIANARAEFRVGDALALPIATASRDIAVSGLVLNFVNDQEKALAEMKRILRAEGIVAFYVWDYPGGGLEFVRHFWKAATALDSNALELAENRRFHFCTREGLTSLAARAGLVRIKSTPIEVPTIFPTIEDYWYPFTRASGPAPGYCASLSPEARQRLKEKLESRLPRGADGSIMLKVRAWAIKAVAR